MKLPLISSGFFLKQINQLRYTPRVDFNHIWFLYIGLGLSLIAKMKKLSKKPAIAMPGVSS